MLGEGLGQRDFFNKIAKQYREYLMLYRYFNAGSLEGCASFRSFYWMQSYTHRHSNLLTENGLTR